MKKMVPSSSDFEQSHFLRPGSNCWRVTQADRAAVLIDGAAYFDAFLHALEHAHESLLIIGWDIDRRAVLRPTCSTTGQTLLTLQDAILNALETHPALKVHILIWDFAMIYAMEREWIPLFPSQWPYHKRLHVRFDDQHPIGASHHQKVVVIDDALAFVGGLDLTKERWDTPEHRPRDPRRKTRNHKLYPPFHDVQVMVDGETASSLGQLGRQRWERSGGERLKVPSSPHDGEHPWPAHIQADLVHVPVGIARTMAAFNGHSGIHEVEQLYLDTIKTARHTIYIENQFLTSHAIGRELETCLAKSDGPEVVIVLRQNGGDWLEQHTMDVLRRRLLGRLHQADRFDRLEVYYPTNERNEQEEAKINLHSKVMIVDDEFICIGSSNLTNRSMKLDTECDLVMLADGKHRLQKGIADVRDRLVGEHLGVSPHLIQEQFARSGSLRETIRGYRNDVRTLRCLGDQEPIGFDRVVSEVEILDPERPMDPDLFVTRFIAPDERPSARRRLKIWMAVISLVAIVTVLWQWIPLQQWKDVQWVFTQVHSFREQAWAPLVMLGIFLLGSVLLVPVTGLILVTLFIFGPVLGFLYSLMGALGGGLLTYVIGYGIGQYGVRRLIGKRLHRWDHRFRDHGLMTMILVHVLPVAPFTIVNLAAGALHFRLRDFLLGTALGIFPGILALAVLMDRVSVTVQKPDSVNFLVLAGVVGILVVGTALLMNWLRNKQVESRGKG